MKIYLHCSAVLGTVAITVTDAGVRALRFDADSRDLPALPPALCEPLDAYLAGGDAPDLPVDGQALGTGFRRQVLDALRTVPRGTTVTYAELAALAGRPGAARAAGTVMRRNELAVLIPCHRVLPASGKLGRYAGGVRRKQALLELEGAWPR